MPTWLYCNVLLRMLIIVGFAFPWQVSSAMSTNHNNKTLFQVATIHSLMQGQYDGESRYRTVMKQGDFGLGTFPALDGEMIALEGHFYQMHAAGKLSLVNPSQKTPFAQVTFFKPTQAIPINNITDYGKLNRWVAKRLSNHNIPYAVRIDGTFNVMQFRVFHKQQPLYQPFAQARHAIFERHTITGTLIGFWFPPSLGTIGAKGLHLHFIDQGHQIGGHVLGLSIKQGELQMQPLTRLEILFDS